jgi:hypothetical protein
VASKPSKIIITDIAIHNPTDQEVKFPPMSSVVIGVDEIMPEAEGEGGGAATMGGGGSSSMGNMTMAVNGLKL